MVVYTSYACFSYDSKILVIIQLKSEIKIILSTYFAFTSLLLSLPLQVSPEFLKYILHITASTTSSSHSQSYHNLSSTLKSLKFYSTQTPITSCH